VEGGDLRIGRSPNSAPVNVSLHVGSQICEAMNQRGGVGWGNSECRPVCVLLSERQGLVIREGNWRGNKWKAKVQTHYICFSDPIRQCCTEYAIKDAAFSDPWPSIIELLFRC
jgi:hypothetical protein